MEFSNQFRLFFLTAISLLLASCGISQGGSDTPAPAVQTAEITYGAIDGFGSVILNGETIPTATALFLVNGFPGTEADLNVGQIVRVLSLTDDGVTEALLVDYQSNVAAPVQAIDAVSGTLTVLGQTVNVDANSVLNLPGVTTLADLTVGTVIEVSALAQLDGDLLASFIGRPADPSQLRLGTEITAVDLNAMLFTLGGIAVDYSQAGVLQLPGGQPAVGQIVVATGAALGGGGQLIADQVIALETDPGLFGLNDTDLTDPAVLSLSVGDLTGFDANFLGFIVMSDSASTLTINDVTVSFDATTNIVGGIANDLAAGTLVQVRGEVTAPGGVRALEITIL